MIADEYLNVNVSSFEYIQKRLYTQSATKLQYFKDVASNPSTCYDATSKQQKISISLSWAALSTQYRVHMAVKNHFSSPL